MNAASIRRAFLEYFATRAHAEVPSSTLVPAELASGEKSERFDTVTGETEAESVPSTASTEGVGSEPRDATG